MKLGTSTLRTLTVAITLACLTQACVPLLVAGVGTGVTSTLDRRTYGEQIVDREIERGFDRKITGPLEKNTSVSATAFNRWVLITGQVFDENSKAEVGKIAQSLSNVREVFNEVAVGYPSDFGNRSNDAYLTSKVKARMYDSPYVSGHHVKVVTESGVVYLMGELTEGEAQAATEVARNTAGVQKVVSVFEIISQERARQLTLQNQSPAPSSSAPVAH